MIPMTLTANSKQVKSFGYDPVSGVLAVIFHRTQKRYEYRNVPPEVAEGLACAESAGKFIAANVKGKFEFEAIDIDADEEQQPAEA